MRLPVLFLIGLAILPAQTVTFTEFTIPTPDSGPFGISEGPDQALWFTEANANRIGRVTTDGVFTEYAIPTPNAKPLSITTGPDYAIWLTEGNAHAIGRLTLTGEFTEYPIPGTYPWGDHGRPARRAVVHRRQRSDRPHNSEWRSCRVPGFGWPMARAGTRQWVLTGCPFSELQISTATT